MNILSLISIMTTFLYVVLIFKIKKTKNLDLLNIFSILVCTCLALWSFCDGFFFVAKTKQEAWVWHHLSSIFWCFYGGVTSYYFLIMSGFHKKLYTIWHQLAFWSIPSALVIHNLFAKTTSLADDLVQSTSGLGWTIKISFESIWTWIYFAFLTLYLGGSLVYLLIWRKKEKEKEDKILAKGFIALNIVCVSACIITYLVLPCLDSYFPPFISSGTLIFIAVYWFVLREYDLLHIEFALDSREIFESCIDAMLITNRNLLIRYANEEAKRLLHVDTVKQKKLTDFIDEDGINTLIQFIQSDSEHLRNIELQLKDETKAICTVSRANTHYRGATVIILSLHDITELKDAQARLDYLAHYDELSNLPNRRMFAQYLKEWENTYHQDHQDFQLLFIDLNNFKKINDNYGHQVGDQVIRKVADAIKSILSEDDVAVRLSGDEFIVMHHLQKKEDKRLLKDDLLRCIEKVKINGLAKNFQVFASIGYACYSETNNIQALVKKADEYMYRNKKLKK